MESDFIPLDAPAVAQEFLNQWEKACTPRAGVDPKNFLSRDFQNSLAKKFAQYTGFPITMGEVDAVARELHTQRVARGWPDPNPKTIEPTIEAVILLFWRNGLYAAERAAESMAFLPIDPPPPGFFDGPDQEYEED
jgi:hypothetical protein